MCIDFGVHEIRQRHSRSSRLPACMRVVVEAALVICVCTRVCSYKYKYTHSHMNMNIGFKFTAVPAMGGAAAGPKIDSTSAALNNFPMYLGSPPQARHTSNHCVHTCIQTQCMHTHMHANKYTNVDYPFRGNTTHTLYKQDANSHQVHQLTQTRTRMHGTQNTHSTLLSRRAWTAY